MLSERTVGGLHAHLVGTVGDLRLSPAASVLDLGCGTGAWLERLRALGFSRLVGIDRTLPDAVPGLEFRRFNLDQDDPAGLGTFPLITCIEVIEHVENVGRLLDLLKMTLAPEGWAIITTPNIESLRARARALISGKIPSFDDKSDATHLMPILNGSLDKMLNRRGMLIQSVQQYPADCSKTLMFSRRTNVVSGIFRLVLPDVLYGDNTVYLVQHASRPHQ